MELQKSGLSDSSFLQRLRHQQPFSPRHRFPCRSLKGPVMQPMDFVVTPTTPVDVAFPAVSCTIIMKNELPNNRFRD